MLYVETQPKSLLNIIFTVLWHINNDIYNCLMIYKYMYHILYIADVSFAIVVSDNNNILIVGSLCFKQTSHKPTM